MTNTQFWAIILMIMIIGYKPGDQKEEWGCGRAVIELLGALIFICMLIVEINFLSILLLETL